MTERHDDLTGALFLLDLLRLIPRHQKITAKQLKEQLNELLEKYRILSEQVQKDSQKTATLLADYNTKKASSDAKYRTVINVLYSLNLKFTQNVSTFGHAKKLELLEMLVKYLYHMLTYIMICCLVLQSR